MVADASNSDLRRLIVDRHAAGQRLDAYLAAQLTSYSRVQLRRAISAGGVRVDGKRAKAAYRLRESQIVTVELPERPPAGPQPEDIPLEILYEDESLVCINKPPAMVVHPAKGHWSGTLTSALAFHFEQLSRVGGASRPGIVHRLDRDTSGVIVVAKNDRAHLALAAQFEQRLAEKQYLAIVVGVPDRDRDMVDLAIGAHPYQREKMAVRSGHSTSRCARTFYEVQERFNGFALVKVTPQTGRTHQIRVHLAHVGCPVLCDRLYGGRARITRGEIRGEPADEHMVLQRHALHAARLRLAHPLNGTPLEFDAPLPEDLRQLLDELRAFRRRD